MAKVNEILEFFNEKAPFYMKLDFDNIGHLVGFSKAEVSRILVALDITDAVVDEAVKLGAQLIVSHHPLIFEPLKRVTDDDIKGRRIIKMLTNGISAICLHTNMDTAEGGVNDALMLALGCENTELLSPHGVHPDGRPYGISRIGRLPEPLEFGCFLERIKNNLNANGLRYVSCGNAVSLIGCCGGAGGGDIVKAYEAGCDTFVTADVKYDQFLFAQDLGMNLIDADHYCTENVIVPKMADMLRAAFSETEVFISAVHRQPVQFY